MEKDILLKIGLTNNEALVYISLLTLGPSLVSSIVDKTKINRTQIYDLLDRLKEKGLISSIIKNRTQIFEAAEPKRILNYIEEKEEKLIEEKKIAKEIVLRLEKIKPKSIQESVKVYEGKQGIKTVLEDIINSKRDIETYGSDGNFTKILDYYFKHYLKKLERSGIKMKVIFDYDEKNKPFNWVFSDVRYLPKEYKSPTETTIYGEKVAIFVLTENPQVVLIENKQVADSYRKYFKILWQKGKKRIT